MGELFSCISLDPPDESNIPALAKRLGLKPTPVWTKSGGKPHAGLTGSFKFMTKTFERHSGIYVKKDRAYGFSTWQQVEAVLLEALSLPRRQNRKKTGGVKQN